MFVQVKRLIEKEKEDIKAMAISQISTLHTQVIEQVRRDQVRHSSLCSIHFLMLNPVHDYSILFRN
jgi:hypothetical protein